MSRDTIVKTIFIASDFKDFLRANNIKIDDKLKKDVFGYNDNSILEVTKSIGSLEILDVKLIDDDLVRRILDTEE